MHLEPSHPPHAEAPSELALLSEYAELNNNFRSLTEIRFKLIAFLPISVVTAATVALAAHSTLPGHYFEVSVIVLSVFGLAVTAGLAAYNERNDQIYVWLVYRAIEIERQLGLHGGSFTSRPQAWFHLTGPRKLTVGHRSSITVIYSASASFLIFVALTAASQIAAVKSGTIAYVVCATVALVIPLLILTWIARSREARSREIFRGVDVALGLLTAGLPNGESEVNQLLDAAEKINGNLKDEEARTEMGRRIAFYSKLESDELEHFIGVRTSALPSKREERLLALLVDLPVAWIAEVPQKRQGPFPHRPA